MTIVAMKRCVQTFCRTYTYKRGTLFQLGFTRCLISHFFLSTNSINSNGRLIYFIGVMKK